MTAPCADRSWREERRLRLVEAAARVFARVPYGQASMDEIAHEAQVGKPTLYRYFPSKTDLFTAVFEQALNDLDERLRRVRAQEIGIEAQLRALVTAIVPMFRDHLLPLRFLDQRGAAADQLRRRVFRENRSRISGHIARALADGCQDGEIACREPARVAELMIGMIWSGAAASAGPDDDIAALVVEVVLQGLLPREAGDEARDFRRGTARRRAELVEGTP